MSDEHDYVGFDELDRLPELNRSNYEFEIDYLRNHLPECASVLQVGSMDGVRILRLLSLRPDLSLTGLEIESDLVDLARENVRRVGRSAEFVAGDIVDPPGDLGPFDYVLCLNNTPGFSIDRIDGDVIHVRDIGRVGRFPRTVVDRWGRCHGDSARLPRPRGLSRIDA